MTQKVYFFRRCARHFAHRTFWADAILLLAAGASGRRVKHAQARAAWNPAMQPAWIGATSSNMFGGNLSQNRAALIPAETVDVRHEVVLSFPTLHASRAAKASG